MREKERGREIVMQEHTHNGNYQVIDMARYILGFAGLGVQLDI